jgi:hypothetical protein
MRDGWQRAWGTFAAMLTAMLLGAGLRAVVGSEFPTELPTEAIADEVLADEGIADEGIVIGEVESIVIDGPLIREKPPTETFLETAPPVPLATCTQAGCGGSRAETYWIFDVVFFQRDNQSTDQILAAVGPDALITTGELQFAVQPGIRLFRGHVDDCGRGWEVGYLGVWNMFADLDQGGVADINAADPLGLLVDGFDGRSLARATYRSTLNTAEVNLLSRSCHRSFCQGSAYPWERCRNYRRGTFDWLAGFRWAGLDEAAGLELSGADYPGPSFYNVRSSTNFFGAQIGGRGRMEWDRWAIDGWAKAALAGTAMSQSADPIGSVFVPDPPIRPARSVTEGGVGFIGDINLNLSYRLSDTWRLRTGYNFLWLTGVALAPNQFDFAATNTAGTGLNGGAGVFLHGANLGLEAAW